MTNLGFINPKSQSVVIEVNMFSKEKITKITSFVQGLPQYTKLEGLRLSVSGILKEFPDLEEKSVPEMKRIALERLKKRLNEFVTEKELIEYIQTELSKYGYKVLYTQKPGFRTVRA